MIEIRDLCKSYRIYRRRSAVLRDLLGFGRVGRDYDLVNSLKSVNIEIPRGQVHGIIGMNGAGKSTLLKILTGVISPTSGSIKIDGRIAALLELGTGFHPELTGRENIQINASILGMPRGEIAQRIPEIIEFSELGDFFDRPVKFYSSGMYVRLAFSFAVAVDPDVLIIDEALAVGDAYFQQKCLKKIRSFKDSGTTILLVSHDLSAIRLLCESVTFLVQGEVHFQGNPTKALDLYNEHLGRFRAEQQKNQLIQNSQKTDAASMQARHESGDRRAEITSVHLIGNHEGKTIAIPSGAEITIVVETKINAEELPAPTCGILIRDRLGYEVFGTNTGYHPFKNTVTRRGDKIRYEFTCDLNLGVGEFTLTIALHGDQTHIGENYHWIERALQFTVLPQNDFHFVGVARLTPEIKIVKA